MTKKSITVNGIKYTVINLENGVIELLDANEYRVANLEFCDQTECAYGSYFNEEEGEIDSIHSSDLYWKYGAMQDGFTLVEVGTWLAATQP